MDKQGNAYEKAPCAFVQPLDTTCVISIGDSLKQTPLNLELGDMIKFEVLATSEFGDSQQTKDEILFAFTPRAVSDLAKVKSETSDSQITLSWSKPTDE